ncbi:MAG: Phosphatidylserine decarboxylase proenzyme [Pseudomonadota bacterium]|nr:Phosphatidylserine decarboxylase proenzyme [Pseudomonadota bacterium]
MFDYLKSSPFYILPHHLISWLVFHVARIRFAPVKNLLLKIYLSLHQVNMAEAEQDDPFAFDTLNAFFTRALKKGVRPLAEGERVLVCPVDGAVSQAQPIKNGRIFQAKGRDYSLLELVGGFEHLAKPFHNGKFATIYLSPRDYHRIHMPMAAKLNEMVYVPGRLFSVAPHTVNTVSRLFARNERVVCAFDTAAGPMIMVLVGAVNVSAIDTVWAGTVTPPSRQHIVHTEYHNDLHIRLERGAEMGRFNLGSTVIVLLPENVELDAAIAAGAPVKMGQSLARY